MLPIWYYLSFSRIGGGRLVPFPSGHSDIVTISAWHCPRYCHNIAGILYMKHMAMSICNINLTSGSWDWTNQALTLPWHRRNDGRYPAKINPPGLLTTPVLATIMSQLKIKASGLFFLSCCYEKLVKYFQKTLHYLKVISNIVIGNTYWENIIK